MTPDKDNQGSQVTLREHLQHPEFQKLLDASAQKAPFGEEEVQDAMYDVIAKMLSQEARFDGAFPSVYALYAYIRKVSFRTLYRKAKQGSTQPFEEERSVQSDKDPEQLLLAALERQSFENLAKQTLDTSEVHGKMGEDIRVLFRLLCKSPDRYIKVRQSGQDKGSFVFDLQGVTKAIGWKRSRVYDRLERLREVLEKALIKQGYTRP